MNDVLLDYKIYLSFIAILVLLPHTLGIVTLIIKYIITGQRSEPDGKEKNLIFEEPINHFTVSTEEKRNVKEKSIEPLEGSHLSMEDWLKSHDEDYNE